jgi:hypothetical protein
MFQMWFSSYGFIRIWNRTTWKGRDIDGNGCIISRYFDRHTQLWDAEAKAYIMAYDKQLRLYNDVRRESKFFRKEGMRIYLLMVIYKL